MTKAETPTRPTHLVYAVKKFGDVRAETREESNA